MHPNPPAQRQKPPDPPVDEYAAMTPLEVATLFKVNPKTIIRWSEDGRLPENSVFRTPGGHRRYFERAVDKLLSKTVADPATRKGMIEHAKAEAKEVMKAGWKNRWGRS